MSEASRGRSGGSSEQARAAKSGPLGQVITNKDSDGERSGLLPGREQLAAAAQQLPDALWQSHGPEAPQRASQGAGRKGNTCLFSHLAQGGSSQAQEKRLVGRMLGVWV